MAQSPDIKVGPGFKCGFIAVAGLPSSGKSTFVNFMLQTKLSIISRKPQTTRNHIKAILNGDGYQAVFIDTPGFLKPKNKFEKKMAEETKRAASEDADILCLIVEPDEKKLLEKIDFFKNLKPASKNVLILNKKDIYPCDKTDKAKKILSEIFKFDLEISVSAKTGENMSEAKKSIINLLPEAAPFYGTDMLSDKWERFFTSELIRETIFENYQHEIPYMCAVEIIDFSETGPEISAYIHISKESHKPIIIGAKGRSIKILRENSERKISRFLNRKIKLSLTVKVTLDWQENPSFLKKIYED